MIGVAVKVTLVPEQMVLSASLELMLTLAGKLLLTAVVMLLEVAGDPVAHVAVEVITTVMASLFARVVVV